jgi:hypothetical protein
LGADAGCFAVVFCEPPDVTDFDFGVAVACTLDDCLPDDFCVFGTSTDFDFGVAVACTLDDCLPDDFCVFGTSTDFDFGVAVACTLDDCLPDDFCVFGTSTDFDLGVGVDFCCVTGLAETAGLVAVVEAAGFKDFDLSGFAEGVILFVATSFGREVGFGVVTSFVLLSLLETVFLPWPDFDVPVFTAFCESEPSLAPVLCLSPLKPDVPALPLFR